MPDQIPTIEVIQGASAASAPQSGPDGRSSRRLWVFLIVFLLCAVAGLFYTYSRPAVYRTTAALLTVAMPAVDQQGAVADIQHVAIQRQLLLSQPLLQEVLERVKQGDHFRYIDSVAQLQGMLFVDSLSDTNIVNVSAEGPIPEVLPAVVNSWVNVYLEVRARKIKESTGATTQALKEQHQALAAKVETRRAELDRFRQEHDILSMGRDENQVLARLKGLTQALNTASEEEVKAKAALEAIHKAIAQGKPVVPKDEQRSLTALETRAQLLREKLTALQRRYTDTFIAIDPNLKTIPKQLQDIQQEIKAKVEYGRKTVLADVEQKWAIARQSVAELRAQLRGHKSKATLFTTRFAEHEALQEDLARLEELHRTTGERLVEIEVENRQKFPQVNVLEYAQLPVHPVRPQYMRDAAIALGVSLLVALFAVWLVEFLLRKEKKQQPQTQAGLHLYTEPQRPAITPSAPVVALSGEAHAALPQPAGIELEGEEIRQLFESSDRIGQQLIALLLSGLTLDEVSRVERHCFDFKSGRLWVAGDQERTLTLAPSVLDLFVENEELEIATIPVAELAAKITLLAVDAGLCEPERVNAESIRQSYLTYLVRQGVKLSEVDQVVGGVSATQLAACAQLSPEGVGKPLEEIGLVYPLFSEAE